MNMNVEPRLLNQADELINLSDREIMALSLGKNDKWAENYQMVITIKLMKTLQSLDDNIISLKKSMNISSLVMAIMTFLILILTGVIVWKGL